MFVSTGRTPHDVLAGSGAASGGRRRYCTAFLVATVVVLLLALLVWRASQDSAVATNTQPRVNPDRGCECPVCVNEGAAAQAQCVTTPTSQGPFGRSNGKHWHVLFSSSCTGYEIPWPSVALIHSFLETQPLNGDVTLTELISCNDKSFVPAWREHVKSPLVHYLLADEMSDAAYERDNYPPLNKPAGFSAWMRTPSVVEALATHGDDDIVVLIDPDMLLQRPVPQVFADVVRPGLIRTARYQWGYVGLDPDSLWHESGWAFPFCKGCEARMKATPEDRRSHVTSGVPAAMTLRDAHRISERWLDMALTTRRLKQHDWLAEQYAFSFTVVEVGLDTFADHRLMASSNDDWFHYNQPSGIPLVLHYCQLYFVGERWRWGKHDHHHTDYLSCDGVKNIEMPPAHYQNLLDNPTQIEHVTKYATWEIWMSISITAQLNAAFDWYRSISGCGAVVEEGCCDA